MSGQGDGLVKYIRYWKASDPSNVIVTEAEEGDGEYSITVDGLSEKTVYCYQMTEYGEVKSFETLEAENLYNDDGDDESEPPITQTTYKKLTSSYKFTIEAETALESGKVIVAMYDTEGKLLTVGFSECDGDTTYSVSLPICDGASRAKIFVWDSYPSMKPKGSAETLIIQ